MYQSVDVAGSSIDASIIQAQSNLDDTLNDTTVNALNNSIGSAEGVDELKQAESKLRTFEKISLYREQKIKQEFERLEADLMGQRHKQVAEMNRTRR